MRLCTALKFETVEDLELYLEALGALGRDGLW